MKRALAFLTLALAACSPSSADPPHIPDQWRALEIRAEPVSFPEPQVGRLRFRGGLQLIGSDHDAFGGLSGLEVFDDGRLLAISDDGEWFEARLTLDQDGDLVGLTHVRSALMRDESGEPFETKRAGDSEDITQLPDGRIAVSFEQTQSIRIYDLNRDGPFGAAQRGPRLDHVRRLPRNAGLEAIASTADGALLVGAEDGGHGGAPLWLGRLDATAPAPIHARFPLSGGYSLTSLDRLPNGDFVALERFYAPVIGARARITTFPAAALAPGGVLEPVTELAVLAPPLPVDNFEGVSAVRMASGATRLYIVSDDNFSDRHRTLLLAFDVVETE